jgi:hypothetical protein
MNNSKLVKFLFADGFTAKQIGMVTRYHESYISKVATGRTAKDVEAEADFEDAATKARYDAMKIILALPDLDTEDKTMWANYFDLLLRLTLRKVQLQERFPIFKEIDRAPFGYKAFDPSLIKMDKETYDDLVSTI